MMQSTATPQVVFTDLDHEEVEEVLGRNKIGRIAFAFHDRVDIQPIHYVYERGWIYGRTSEGTKLAMLKHNQWMAFEVDEVKDTFDWKSVVAHGSFWLLRPNATPHSTDVWNHAVRLLRQVVPGTMTDDDPVPFRQMLFRIAIADVRGRQAASATTNSNESEKENK
jgi:nitroimidazol reductase NimA-like FMN-containing flavoprotein (pyridoxamine 5'-phosphate oxidase superfamily)